MQWQCGPGMSSVINGERTCLYSLLVLLLTVSFSISVPFVGSRSWVSFNAKSASRSIVLENGQSFSKAFRYWETIGNQGPRDVKIYLILYLMIQRNLYTIV